MTTNNLKRYEFRCDPDEEYFEYSCNHADDDCSGTYYLASDVDALIAELAAERDEARRIIAEQLVEIKRVCDARERFQCWVEEIIFASPSAGHLSLRQRQVDAVKRDLSALTAAQGEVERLKEDLELIRVDHAQTIDELCNYAWQKVYGDGRTDWEYPAQAIRHLVDYAGEKEQEIAALRQRAEEAERWAEEFARGIFEKGTIHDKTVGNEWYSSYADGFQEAAGYLVSIGKLERHPTQKGWYRWLPQPTAVDEGEGEKS